MSKLKRLSGKQVAAICLEQGFEISRQRGSHITLVRRVSIIKQILIVPNHRELHKGTLSGIYKQLLRFVADHNLREFFYTSDK